MTPAALTISAAERDTLHELMLRRLFVLGDDPVALARAEGVTSDRLAEEFGEDLRLMHDLGWPLGEGDRDGVELTLPSDRLAATLRRLRRDARRAPCEQRHEFEPEETDEERWRRFRDAVAVCDELVIRLESPQHRAWRQARTEAAVRIEGFRRDLTDAVEKAGELIDQHRPVMSREWFELSERLRWSCWRLASATYCLTEWMEPEDERPDVDENPGPHPGRRTISAWDDPPRSREGS